MLQLWWQRSPRVPAAGGPAPRAARWIPALSDRTAGFFGAAVVAYAVGLTA
jgi:hypothetical protein